MEIIPELERMLPVGTYQYTGESTTKRTLEPRKVGEICPLEPHEKAELVAMTKRLGLKPPSRY